MATATEACLSSVPDEVSGRRHGAGHGPSKGVIGVFCRVNTGDYKYRATGPRFDLIQGVMGSKIWGFRAL